MLVDLRARAGNHDGAVGRQPRHGLEDKPWLHTKRIDKGSAVQPLEQVYLPIEHTKEWDGWMNDQSFPDARVGDGGSALGTVEENAGRADRPSREDHILRIDRHGRARRNLQLTWIDNRVPV